MALFGNQFQGIQQGTGSGSYPFVPQQGNVMNMSGVLAPQGQFQTPPFQVPQNGSSGQLRGPQPVPEPGVGAGTAYNLPTPNYAKWGDIGGGHPSFLLQAHPGLDLDTNAYMNHSATNGIFGQSRETRDNGFIDQLNAAVKSGQLTQDQANQHWSTYRESQKEYQRGLDTQSRQNNQGSIVKAATVAGLPFLGAAAGIGAGAGAAGASEAGAAAAPELLGGPSTLEGAMAMGGPGVAATGELPGGAIFPATDGAAASGAGAAAGAGAASTTGAGSIFNLATIIGGVGNFLGGALGNRRTQGLASAGSNASNPLAAPQRQPYQQQLSELTGPNGGANFIANDPTIQAQRKMIGDWAQANFAKSGNLPLTEIQGSAQLAGVMGQQYNQRIQDMLMAGGFTQGNPYGGQPFTSAMGPTQANTGTQLAGIGNVLQAGLPYVKQAGSWLSDWLGMNQPELLS